MKKCVCGVDSRQRLPRFVLCRWRSVGTAQWVFWSTATIGGAASTARIVDNIIDHRSSAWQYRFSMGDSWPQKIFLPELPSRAGSLFQIREDRYLSKCLTHDVTCRAIAHCCRLGQAGCRLLQASYFLSRRIYSTNVYIQNQRRTTQLNYILGRLQKLKLHTPSRGV